MRSGGNAGGTDYANNVALQHYVALAYIAGGHVSIEGISSVAVVDHYIVAVAGAIGRGGYVSSVGSVNIRSVACPDVNTVMHTVIAIHRVQTVAEK